MDDLKSIGLGLSLIGLSLSIASIFLISRGANMQAEKGNITVADMTEADLIARGLWDECSGEPMNEFAEEHERRYGLDAQAGKENDRG